MHKLLGPIPIALVSLLAAVLFVRLMPNFPLMGTCMAVVSVLLLVLAMALFALQELEEWQRAQEREARRERRRRPQRTVRTRRTVGDPVPRSRRAAYDPDPYANPYTETYAYNDSYMNEPITFEGQEPRWDYDEEAGWHKPTPLAQVRDTDTEVLDRERLADVRYEDADYEQVPEGYNPVPWTSIGTRLC